MKIAVDAMGGDQAPDEIVKGAIQAELDFPDIELIYVGDQKRVEQCHHKYRPGHLSQPQIIHSDHVIEMHDSPLSVVKEKKDNSISKAIQLNKDGEAQAFVSAGNTGACVAAATLILRMLEGIQRPAIACTMPSKNGRCLVLDCGANVNARPRHLLEYAIVGQAFSHFVHGQQNVRVGLLNIGEEDVKGNDLVKETFDLLNEHRQKINFIGNVEARDIFNGTVDVVVCEGFVGNSLLKGAEGLAELFFKSLKEVFQRNWTTKLAALFLKPSLLELKAQADPNELGGAPLLGVNGHVIISHGSSSPWGIRNAIRTAREMVNNELNVNIQRLL